MISLARFPALPTRVHRPLPSHLRVSFVFLLMLEELDLVTTLTGHPGMQESNVLVAGVLAAGGGFAFLLMKSVGGVIMYFSLAHLAHISRRISECVLAVATLLMVGVVLSNLRLMLG